MLKSFSEFKGNISESSNLGIESGSKWIRSFYQYIGESIGEAMRSQVVAMSNADALEKAEKIIEMSTLKIFTHYPMFRPFIDLMPPIAKFGAGSKGPDGIGTMATSGSAIFFDPRFVILAYEQGKIDFANEIDPKTAKLHFQVLKAGKRHASDYVTFVLVHEILHNSLKHFLRKPVLSDQLSEYEIHRLWNIATDYEINHTLKPDEMLRMFPGGVDAEEGPFAVPEEEREFFTETAAEKIFWRLLKNLEEKRRQESGEDQDDETEGQPGDQEGEDEGDGGQGQDGESGDGGEEQDGDGESGSGEGQGQGGDGGDSDGEDRPLRVGDVIIDNETGTYGRVTSISGDNVEYEEISREQAESIVNFTWLDQNT